MIKASAGGGGKGLRVAWNDLQAEEGFTSCRNEAKASFGDDRVFIEKFVEQPRHIEIQVLGDAHGHCVYLWERECSIQRRHQKVVEEAPSAFLDEATRRAMGEQAVALAKAVGYQSAGTVEFVVGKDKSFYFLEMNTRLQVEHPVTECITGLDLVEQMIRVAAGEQLAFAQADIAPPRLGDRVPHQRRGSGARLPAEHRPAGHVPAAGRDACRPARRRPPARPAFASTPASTRAARSPIHYDSMICKLIACGADRAAAIATLRDALNGFVIRGVSSNLAFQAALLGHPRFASGDFNTGFIAEEFPHGFDPAAVAARRPRSPAGARRRRRAALAGALGRPHRPAARPRAAHRQRLRGRRGRRRRHAPRDCGRGARRPAPNIVSACTAERGGSLRRAAAPTSLCTATSTARRFVPRSSALGWCWRVAHDGARVEVRVLTPRAAELRALMPFKPPPDLSRFLLSPMPGLLVNVAVRPARRCAPASASR